MAATPVIKTISNLLFTPFRFIFKSLTSKTWPGKEVYYRKWQKLTNHKGIAYQRALWALKWFVSIHLASFNLVVNHLRPANDNQLIVKKTSNYKFT